MLKLLFGLIDDCELSSERGERQVCIFVTNSMVNRYIEKFLA